MSSSSSSSYSCIHDPANFRFDSFFSSRAEQLSISKYQRAAINEQALTRHVTRLPTAVLPTLIVFF